jgi:iron complex outermembrane receptor protein
MTGIEAFFQTKLNLANQHTLHLQTQASLNRHSFEQVAETLPGTPLHASSFLVAYAAKKWTISAMHYWNDRMPLHNSKDDWSNAHQRLDGWLSLQTKANVWQFGVRNVLKAQYSSWFQTNAFGGRYFNPAPGRLIWLSWKWQIN